MTRKSVALLAGWLAAASAGWAQTETYPVTNAGGTPAARAKPLSPYYPGAGTSDWSAGEQTDLPPVRPATLPPQSQSRYNFPVTQVQAPASLPSAIPGTTPPPMYQPGTIPAPAALPSQAAPVQAAPQVPGGPVGTAPAANAPVAGVPGAACGPTGCAPCVPAVCNPCGPNGPCGPMGRVWFSAEYILWATKGMYVPPLVTASPLGTPREQAGVLGAPGTRVLFGGDTVNNDLTSGVRIRGGMWLDECQTCGIDGGGFYLGQQSENATYNCADSPILARPFSNAFNPNPAIFITPDSELVCLPGVLNGSVDVQTYTDFYGFDANFIKNLCCSCNYRIDGLVGYRYLYLEDGVEITENLVAIDPTNTALPAGTSFVVNDRFVSQNIFNGAQLGVGGEYRFGRLYVAGRSTIALGNTQSKVDINGFTKVTPPPAGPTTMYAGGLLAQPTNIGSYTRNTFSVVPEFTVSAGYFLTNHIRAFVGYTFLYWSNVARAGDQIDLVVNSTQIPPGTLQGAARPAFKWAETDFWAQGISFGLEFRY